MRATLFLILLALSSAACSSPEEIGEATGVAAAEATARAAPGAAPASFQDNEERGGGSREFKYQWPSAVSEHPALVARLSAERDRILAQEKSEWSEALASSPEDCVSCRSRSFAKQWKLVADTPGFISLSGEFSTYTGGAHGMYGLESLVWDKTGRALTGVGLFRSPDALEAALGPKLCKALNAERAKRRGEPVAPAGGDDFGFDSCQHVRDATVLVGSSNGKAFDRIGIWFGPYVAGPYAEGAYELNFPVDAAVLRAVKPEFAGAFGVK